MRVLLVGAGAASSIRDVETGLYDGLTEQGVDVQQYALGNRINLSSAWLRKLWRKRGKPPEDKPDWSDTLYHASRDALDMAVHARVDWVIVVSGMYLHPNVLEMMRRQGLRVAVVFTESPYSDPQQARLASLVDMCWTNERTSVNYLRQFNPRTQYLRAAYDPLRHNPVRVFGGAPDVPAHDVVFVGIGFQERIDVLSAVDWTGIDLGLYGSWSLLGSRHRLRKYVRGGVIDNERAVALYKAAKIGLNLHRTSTLLNAKSPRVTTAESMNPRGYELAACGVFQISDMRPEVLETFGTMVPRYINPAHLEDVVRIFLEDADARTEYARFARKAILPHTFAARAAQILADLEVIEQPIAKGA